jgi:hypothetical protein
LSRNVAELIAHRVDNLGPRKSRDLVAKVPRGSSALATAPAVSDANAALTAEGVLAGVVREAGTPFVALGTIGDAFTGELINIAAIATLLSIKGVSSLVAGEELITRTTT